MAAKVSPHLPPKQRGSILTGTIDDFRDRGYINFRHTRSEHETVPQKPDYKPTLHALKILKVLLEDRRGLHSGAALSKATGIGSGSLYPTLKALEDIGWIEGEWENIDPSAEGRPQRRFYHLTGVGQRCAYRELESLQLRPVRGGLAWNT
jgi:PadR family transcriptional regulator, regulatory protein PadR